MNWPMCKSKEAGFDRISRLMCALLARLQTLMKLLEAETREEAEQPEVRPRAPQSGERHLMQACQ